MYPTLKLNLLFSWRCEWSKLNFLIWHHLFKLIWYFLFYSYDKPKADSRSKRAAQLANQKKSDSLDSLSSIGSAETIIYRDKIARPKRKRRVSFLKLPFKIWESSDEEHSNCSDDTKTLVQNNAISEAGSKKSFIENGGSITLPMTIGSYPKPSPGQSIMSFLSSGVFTRTNAELDRENAHFSVAEALIAVLEQVRTIV